MTPLDRLYADPVLDTVRRLERRIGARFPERDLRRVAGELATVVADVQTGAADVGGRVRRARVASRVLVAVVLVATAVLLISIGIVVNMLGTTGLGNTFGLMIDTWSNGNVLIAIVLIGLVSLVLGMGLPVTASYIVLATMAAPALTEMITHGHLVSAIAAGDVPNQILTMLQALGVAGADALGSPMSHVDWDAGPETPTWNGCSKPPTPSGLLR